MADDTFFVPIPHKGDMSDAWPAQVSARRLAAATYRGSFAPRLILEDQEPPVVTLERGEATLPDPVAVQHEVRVSAGDF